MLKSPSLNFNPEGGGGGGAGTEASSHVSVLPKF